MDNNNNTKKPNLFCEICKFQAVRPAEFIRHVESNKHKRNGLKIKDTVFKCELCDKILINHFSYKIHKIQMHATLEEKRKQRYYCEICDVVFLSKLYMDKHNIGIRHNNISKSIKLLEDIKIQQLQNKLNIKLSELKIDIDSFISATESYIDQSKKFINKLT
jgi:hypothetical protein